MSTYLSLHRSTVHTVFSIQKLDNVAIGITDSAIVTNLEILHCLDETTLNVSRFGSLDGSIDKTFSTTHGVEPELLRCQTSEVRVFDETSRFGSVVVSRKVGQCTVFETEVDSLSLDKLLTDDTAHLRNVDKGSLGSRDHHLLDVVVILQIHLRRFTRPVTSLVQLGRNLLLERLSDRHSRLGLHLVCFGPVD